MLLEFEDRLRKHCKALGIETVYRDLALADKLDVVVYMVVGQGALRPFLVLGNSDRITVLKTGRVVGTRQVAETSREEILRMIVTGTAEGHARREPKSAAV